MLLQRDLHLVCVVFLLYPVSPTEEAEDSHVFSETRETSRRRLSQTAARAASQGGVTHAENKTLSALFCIYLTGTVDHQKQASTLSLAFQSEMSPFKCHDHWSRFINCIVLSV